MEPIDPTLMDVFSYDNIPNDMRITLSFQEILIKATYHNNYELVKKLICMDEFDKSMLEDIGLLSKPFPLYFITMCYKRVMWSDFRKDTMPFVESQRTGINKLQTLWQEEFGINTHRQIDYKQYEEYFFCAKDSDTLEDVLGYPVSEFLDNGCRDIDLKLYEAVGKLHFKEAKTLLENGANPNAKLRPITRRDDIDYLNCGDRIGNERLYLCSCEVFPLIGRRHGLWYLNCPLTNKDIGDLVGWAAHDEMWSILKPYIKDTEKNM